MTLNQFVRNARIKAGLTQGDLAKLLKINSGTQISNIERGDANLSPGKYRAFCKALKVDTATFKRVLVSNYRKELDGLLQ